MTRNGKIARLPLAIRLQLNQRLQDGEVGARLIEWLNSLPEVQSVLAAHFNAQPVNDQNLSDWKEGGYRDWETQTQAAEVARSFLEGTSELPQTATSTLTDRLRAFCAARLTLELQRLDSLEDGPEKRNQWRLLFTQMALLSRADHYLDRTRFHREQLNFQRQKSLSEKEKEFEAWAKKPENQARFRPSIPLTAEEKRAAVRKILGIADIPQEPAKPAAKPPKKKPPTVPITPGQADSR